MYIYIGSAIFNDNSGTHFQNDMAFKTLQGVSEWMKENFREHAEMMNYPEDWDGEDMGCSFPDRNEIFSLENLLANLEKNKEQQLQFAIWGPESKHESCIPWKYTIQKLKLHE